MKKSLLVTPLLLPLISRGVGNDWSIIDANGSHLGSGFEAHTADEIVKAVNAAPRLAQALRDITDAIYAVGAPLGSDNYFKIRELATMPLQGLGLPVTNYEVRKGVHP